jgi:hypothetical protein
MTALTGAARLLRGRLARPDRCHIELGGRERGGLCAESRSEWCRADDDQKDGERRYDHGSPSGRISSPRAVKD